MSRIEELKSTGYQSTQESEPNSPAAAKKVGAKRTHKDLIGAVAKEEEKKKAPSGVRRKAKEVAKVGERASKRIAGKEKVAYDEKAIDKLIDEASGLKAGGKGCISVMLAHNYDPEKHSVTGWLMSEKLDGVRCYWNGVNMYTRNGNPFYAPDEWKAKLPKMALDGELWTNRDDFQKIVSIVRKHDKNSEEWKKISFMVFDAPLVKGNFKKRTQVCEAEIAKMTDTVCKVLPQKVCKSADQLATLMDTVLSDKGEGVMLKDPNSAYEGRRSQSLLKVKRFEDTEATVIGHLKGTGRCADMCGAI